MIRRKEKKRKRENENGFDELANLVPHPQGNFNVHDAFNFFILQIIFQIARI